MSLLTYENFARSLIALMCLGQSLNAEQDFWDPHSYRQSASMQRRWIASLLSQTQIHLCNKILDLGCGDGIITAQLAMEHPERQVLGVDLSQKMIDFANQSFSSIQNLRFHQENAETITFTNKFDGIVSFNTFHRLNNPKLALLRIFDALIPGGHLAAVFPAIGSKILTTSIAAVDSRKQWKDYFKNPDRKNYSNSEETYSTYLKDIGFVIERVKIIWEDEIFENRTAFFNILKASYNQKDNIPKEKQDDFFNEVLDEYLKFMPLDHDGRLHFYFNRMEIIAYKPLIPNQKTL